MRLLEALPFDALREFVGRRGAPADSAPGSLSAHEPVIHIWGPVMVIPFSGHDEALAAIELIGRDPEAARVSVVVVDLTGTIVDEAFGATSLERIIDCVEAWGADCLLAGVSPLAREVVAGLERQPLVIHKDLHAAIAGAFQIAEAQRRVA